jgi:LPS export ABC transporter protein LptC
MKQKELERWYRLKNLKRASQFLVVAAILLLVVGYSASRLVKSNPEAFDSPTQSEPGSRIENFSFSAPGANPWELKAPVALISDDLSTVILKNPEVEYHGGKGGTIYLSAESGEFDRKSSNLYARGNVVIRYRDMTFNTVEIMYSQETHMAHTSSPVSIKSGDGQLTGKGLKLSVENEEIEIEQDVQARLFNVKWTEPANKLPM